jgi:uncharacterized OB-fold protein
MSGQTSGPEQTYFDHLAKGEFMLQHCGACAKVVFYPRAICPHCSADALEWRSATGRGTVYSTSVVRQRPEKGGVYNVALIDFAEGGRMMSRVDGIAPEAVSIGMAVVAEIDSTGETPLVVFRPADGGAS